MDVAVGEDLYPFFVKVFLGAYPFLSNAHVLILPLDTAVFPKWDRCKMQNATEPGTIDRMYNVPVYQ